MVRAEQDREQRLVKGTESRIPVSSFVRRNRTTAGDRAKLGRAELDRGQYRFFLYQAEPDKYEAVIANIKLARLVSVKMPCGAFAAGFSLTVPAQLDCLAITVYLSERSAIANRKIMM